MLTDLELLGKYAERSFVTTFKFKPGINILVGPNGSGKSTTIQCIKKEILPVKKLDEWDHPKKDQKRYANWKVVGLSKVIAYDFEMDNPRTGLPSGLYSQKDITRTLIYKKAVSKSHGEFSKEFIEHIKKPLEDKKSVLFLFDEPEQGLDIDGILTLISFFKKVKSEDQIIVSTHHPLFMCEETFNYIEFKEGYKQYIIDKIKNSFKDY